ncbi:hypothetical protein JNUCC1_03391 [Lentibacillus sp. JNUCC-1]|uniref:YhcN/YlaJ family sporulation lipoprotein n=1 Tax=Lentibacillus sp. JNUCC-1 TaxID=2654513 RepID=UPI0012E7A9D0|nr:YhcN/YlaJ family sporulation lipoprotein [Lentibacillus sp. JNUCC-1]MUV39513.1 hypothetical protein [Lentibacillus sp. JNUCC-1]
MKRAYITCLLSGFLLLTGCAQENSQSPSEKEGTKTDPVNYETADERDQKPGNDKRIYGTPEEKKRINSGNRNRQYTDLFTTEESQEISDRLLHNKDITQAQVAIKDDEVIVAVMLAPGSSNKIRHKVKSDVQTMMPDKKVTVYTDARYLDHKDDMNAGRKPSDVDSYIQEYLENFFDK